MTIPANRRRRLNNSPRRPQGDFVLYWMVAHRRPHYNFALQRARDLAVEADKPLLIVEALRHGYQWASHRFHTFILEGMASNKKAFSTQSVRYYPFVETSECSGSGLIEELAEHSHGVITDDFPEFFLPHMIEAAAQKVDVALEAVDSNGLLPMRNTDKLYKRAYDFRRYVHDIFLEDDLVWPEEDPLADADLAAAPQLPDSIISTWPEADDGWLSADTELLDSLPIDDEIEANPDIPGGFEPARERLQRFFDGPLSTYHERRNELTDDAESGLSPYLHFGHISSHHIFRILVQQEDWSPRDIDEDYRAKREQFWGMSPGAESFVDQLLTWRELGFNRCALDPEGYDNYETLPDWAKTTLAEHEDDPRPHVYDLEEFESAQTHDPLWNAAQTQLVTTGTMHNYLRMFWGKKILHWSQSPRQALEFMIELNNKYGLDGRDPNSYNGIFWVLGRFDRAWGPEREVFGKIRYMTSKSTHRKFNTSAYIERYGQSDQQGLDL